MNNESLRKTWAIHIRLAAREWDKFEHSFRRSVHGDLLREAASLVRAGEVNMTQPIDKIQLALGRAGVDQAVTVGNEAREAVRKFIP